jgi:hypothetical protein
MAFSRRWFLRNTVATPFLLTGLLESKLASAAEITLPRPLPARIKIDETSFAAWMDTLLPGDGTSPAASTIGVNTTLRELAKKNRRLAELLAHGLQWLDDEAAGSRPRPFALTSQARRDDIAELAQNSPDNTLQNRFFVLTLNQGYHYYYADRRSWQALHYPGPPQPAGFMDFQNAPGSDAHDA